MNPLRALTGGRVFKISALWILFVILLHVMPIAFLFWQYRAQESGGLSAWGFDRWALARQLFIPPLALVLVWLAVRQFATKSGAT